jgi:hypothetical protein
VFVIARGVVAVSKEAMPASLLGVLNQQIAQHLSDVSYHHPSLEMVFRYVVCPVHLLHNEVDRLAGHALLLAAVPDEAVRR